MVVKKLLITALLALAWAGNVWGAHELDFPPKRSAEEYLANPSLALKDARSFFQYGDYKEAIRLSNNYYNLTGKNDAAELLSQAQQCQENMEKARILEDQGDKASAARCYKSILDMNPLDLIAKQKYDEMIRKENERKVEEQPVIVQTPRTPPVRRPRKSLAPERFSMGVDVIGGSTLGVAMDFTTSYFLFGVGIDWVMTKPKSTVTSSLVNSGYVGNFTKTTTLSLDGTRTNVFLNLGAYFKYFSLSCQAGLLWATVQRSSVYKGSGYGLKDGDLDEYWGSYSQRSLTGSESSHGTYFTLTPQVKGYIPIGDSFSISLGLGYTFIPALKCHPGLSGSLGLHVPLN